MVATRRFALGACQRVLFTRLGVQENREILADGQIAQCGQLFGRTSDHNPIMVLHRQAQQGIPNRTTDHVNLHRGSLALPGRLIAQANSDQIFTPKGRISGACRIDPIRLLKITKVVFKHRVVYPRFHAVRGAKPVYVSGDVGRDR